MTFRKLSNGGCSASGRKIIRTRGRISTRIKLPKIAYSFRYTYPMVLTTFKLTPFYNKLLSLMILPSGGLAYVPATLKNSLFTVVSFKHPDSPFWIKRNRACLTILLMIRQFRKISNFELWPGKGVQYARSAGSWGKVTNRDLVKYTSMVYLPSGVRKIVSIFSLALPGRSACFEKRLIRNTKAGFRKRFGFKSIVRGVAMNPVDHPHGGRTKAIKYPRTPWGTTTKFK